MPDSAHPSPLSPAAKARIVQLAMLDAARSGEPGAVDAIVEKLKADPQFVEKLAEEYHAEKGAVE